MQFHRFKISLIWKPSLNHVNALQIIKELLTNVLYILLNKCLKLIEETFAMKKFTVLIMNDVYFFKHWWLAVNRSSILKFLGRISWNNKMSINYRKINLLATLQSFTSKTQLVWEVFLAPASILLFLFEQQPLSWVNITAIFCTR